MKDHRNNLDGFRITKQFYFLFKKLSQDDEQLMASS
jgi:hypothetical protein